MYRFKQIIPGRNECNTSFWYLQNCGVSCFKQYFSGWVEFHIRDRIVPKSMLSVVKKTGHIKRFLHLPATMVSSLSYVPVAVIFALFCSPLCCDCVRDLMVKLLLQLPFNHTKQYVKDDVWISNYTNSEIIWKVKREYKHQLEPATLQILLDVVQEYLNNQTKCPWIQKESNSTESNNKSTYFGVVVYPILLVVCTVGNLLNIIVLSRVKHARSTTVYFIAMSVADLLTL